MQIGKLKCLTVSAYRIHRSHHCVYRRWWHSMAGSHIHSIQFSISCLV